MHFMQPMQQLDACPKLVGAHHNVFGTNQRKQVACAHHAQMYWWEGQGLHTHTVLKVWLLTTMSLDMEGQGTANR